ncbi:hypothetical protein [Nonomuraea insulae]|uniref:WXG100 family type VII secretion target n=1 Tax=Nonomuraea insulae TaxID=1616787 RepID=A0ABW1CJI0_9ACTN
MTVPNQGQLFRQAAEKELLATSLTRYADELEGVFSGTLAKPQEAHAFWKGPAADRFATQAGQLRREVGILAENCRSTAHHLRHQAQILRNEAGQLPA